MASKRPKAAVQPLRDRSLERTLVAGRGKRLTREAFERKALAPLASLIARAAWWPESQYAKTWRIGDFTFLIVTAALAEGAELYVQFWAEPGQPLEWEVNSGHSDASFKRFVTRRARTRLAGMGLEIGGAAKNFRRTVSIASRQDAVAVAEQVLRIFWDAFGYRGTTPMVVKVTESGRSGRAVVHRGLTAEDMVNLLTRLGCEAHVQAGSPPIIHAARESFNFVVIPDVQDADVTGFQCFDFVTAVGRAEESTFAAWTEELAKLNAVSRPARGWLDADGNVLVATSIVLIGGVTETWIQGMLEGWERAVASVILPPHRTRRKKRRPSAGFDLESMEEPRRRKAIIH